MAGSSILTLINIPQTYSWLHLGFYHFVVSIVLVGLSGVFMLIYLYFYLTWGPSEPETPIFSTREPIRTQPIVNKPSPRRQGRKFRSNIDPPTKEQLHKLKEALDIGKGSLQYKKRGQGVYHVTYENGKYQWQYLGSWSELKGKS